MTACQQSCPTQAIVFGDLNDTKSKVYQWHHDRSGVCAAGRRIADASRGIRYLAKISNPVETLDIQVSKAKRWQAFRQLNSHASPALTEADNTTDDPRFRPPLVTGNKEFADVTATVAGVAERPRRRKAWYVALGISLSLLGLLGAMVGYLFLTGVGVWGNNQPVGWGFGIVNFVFWVGIGHAGTLISAILYLFRQNWRTGINRMAEAMTIFAVVCAGLFPGIHVGRPWLAYWLFPIPNQMDLWPQFRSPLLWDVFAVGTYATVSLLFWYVGMVPDIATFRDRSKSRIKQIVYGIFVAGLERIQPALASLRAGVSAAGRAGDAAGVVGALGGEL